MATAAVEAKQQEFHVPSNQNPILGPPSYSETARPSSAAYGGPGSNPRCFENGTFESNTTFLCPNPGAPTVTVTQPVVVDSAAPPSTMLAFFVSTLSAIFCGLWCGAAGILLAWKAQLHVLDRKYEHARSSLNVVWIFVGLSCFFGALLWFFVLRIFVISNL